jgi:glycine/D-amino acid oxidase-like deaminating enzyme
MSYDVVVVGAGIVGCATAAFLAERGVRVGVFDAGAIGAGASGRNAGLVEHPFDREQVALHEETVALLADLLEPEPAGVLLLFADERGAERAVREAAAFPELAARTLAPDAVAALEDGVREGLWGVHLATGWPVRPAAAVERFADLARARGAEFHTNMPVALEDVRQRAEAVVVAAGAASSALVDPTGAWAPVRPLWGVAATLDAAARRPRIPLMDGRGEVPPEAFTLIATPDELVLGSVWADEEPDGPTTAARLLANAASFWPAAAEARIAAVRVCPRPSSFDGRPLLGRVPNRDGLWLAAGHGGRGISTGAATARLLADALLAGSDAAIPAPLRADRFPAPR